MASQGSFDSSAAEQYLADRKTSVLLVSRMLEWVPSSINHLAECCAFAGWAAVQRDFSDSSQQPPAGTPGRIGLPDRRLQLSS